MSVGTLFDGVNDNIQCGANDLTLSTLKVAALVNYNAAPSAFHSIVTVYTASATPSIALYHDTAQGGLRISATAASQVGVAFTPTVGVWYLIIVTKATGTATPRFHIYNFTTAAWSHTDAGGSIATGSGTITDLRIGSDDSGSGAPFNGDIALVGIGTGNSDDTASETFLDYTALAAESWQFFTGTSMINGATVNDIGSANNDETARTGTAGGRHHLPVGFTNFDATPGGEFATIGARTTTGTTSCAIAVPTGIVADDMLIASTIGKPSTATTTNPPASGGFTALANTTGGGGSQGTDTGPQREATAYKEAVGGEGTLTYTWANTPNSVTGLMARYQKAAAHTWETPAVATGDDSSVGTSMSAVSGTIAVAVGDTLLATWGGSTDATTAYTAAGFSGSGLTFSTPVIRANAGGAGTGQDVGQMWTEAHVMTGSGTVAITATLTGGPTSSGPVHIIRLRAITSTDTNVDAGTATGTGTANQASVNVAPNAGTATATGTANQPAVKVNPNAGTATATGVANQPTITASSNVPAGHATATGVANQPTITASSNVPAGHAAGTGTVDQPATHVAPNAGTATATGTANQASTSVVVNAGTATGTGAAFDATVSTAVQTNAPAGEAVGTGTADTPSVKVTPNAGTATATGVANNATVSTTAQTNVDAGTATGTGTANTVSSHVKPNAGTATATGTANNATVVTDSSTSVDAGHAAATGTAFNASVKVAFTAGTATALATGYDPAVGISPSAGTGTGSAVGFDSPVLIAVNAGTADGTGTAENPTGPTLPTAPDVPPIHSKAPAAITSTAPDTIRSQAPSAVRSTV